MEEPVRKAAALAVGAISIATAGPALAATTPGTQTQYTLSLTPSGGTTGGESGKLSGSGYKLENIAILYGAAPGAGTGGSGGLKGAGAPLIKYEDKWSPGSALSFVGPASAGTEFLILGEFASGNKVDGVFAALADKTAQGAIKIEESLQTLLGLPLGYQGTDKLSALSLQSIESYLSNQNTSALDLLYKESFAAGLGGTQLLKLANTVAGEGKVDYKITGDLLGFTSNLGGQKGADALVGTFGLSDRLVPVQSPVPEPETVFTMLAGVLAVFGIGRKRRKKTVGES